MEKKQTIPINIISSILMGTYFKKVIEYNQNTEYFKNLEIDSILFSLNKYMSYMIEHQSQIPKEVFEIINCINTFYNIKIQYDYKEYLNKPKSIISMGLLFKIITDKETFNRFMNFEDNKAYFQNLDLNIYIKNLDDMINFLQKSNIKMSDNSLRHIDIIMNKYTKNKNLLSGYKPTIDINNELVNNILNKIDITWDSFTKSRAIYIYLSQFLSYDTEFLITEKQRQNQIYSISPNEVFSKSNTVVCKTWAEIFSSLLDIYCISSFVNNGYHKYVILNVDGIFIKADATNALANKIDNFKMCDLDRIKLGLKTTGFNSFENYCDVSSLIQKADNIIHFNSKTFSEKKDDIFLYSENYLLENEGITMFKKVVSDLKEKKLMSFEIPQYLNALRKSFKMNNMDIIYVTIKTKNQYSGGSIIKIISNEETNYYLQTHNGIKQLEKEKLIEYIDLGCIKEINNEHPIFEKKEDINTLIK